MAKAASRALIELCGRLREWRAREGGGRGKRVPVELWQEAVRVTQTDGLHATARATRLNYDRLKKRIGSEDKSVRPRRARTNGPVAGGRAHPVHVSTVPSKGFVALQVAPKPVRLPD
jgi:hypothetical protein